MNSTSPLAKQLPLYIDSTMRSAFVQCPQKFNNEFFTGLRPVGTSIDLHAGGCFASAIENVSRMVYCEGKTLVDAEMRAFALFMDQWGDFEILKDTPKTRERTWEAVEEYYKKWSPLTDSVQPIDTKKGSFEFTFGIPLEPSVDYSSDPAVNKKNMEAGFFPRHPSGSPFLYAGRFDMLGLWSGKPVVRDEKTTTSIGASWAQKWDLRSQFMGYCWACQQSGIDVDTVCVRGIGILKTKFTLVEAFKTFSQFKIDRWHEQLRRDLWRLRRAYDEDYWDFNFADACESYGGCPFVDLCSSPNPKAWHSNFAVRHWNPMQRNPTAAPEDASNGPT